MYVGEGVIVGVGVIEGVTVGVIDILGVIEGVTEGDTGTQSGSTVSILSIIDGVPKPS